MKLKFREVSNLSKVIVYVVRAKAGSQTQIFYPPFTFNYIGSSSHCFSSELLPQFAD